MRLLASNLLPLGDISGPFIQSSPASPPPPLHSRLLVGHKLATASSISVIIIFIFRLRLRLRLLESLESWRPKIGARENARLVVKCATAESSEVNQMLPS